MPLGVTSHMSPDSRGDDHVAIPDSRLVDPEIAAQQAGLTRQGDPGTDDRVAVVRDLDDLSGLAVAGVDVADLETRVHARAERS